MIVTFLMLFMLSFVCSVGFIFLVGFLMLISNDVVSSSWKFLDEQGGPVDSQKILVFEDAPSGVGAAKNAGMWVIILNHFLISCYIVYCMDMFKLVL